MQLLCRPLLFSDPHPPTSCRWPLTPTSSVLIPQARAAVKPLKGLSGDSNFACGRELVLGSVARVVRKSTVGNGGNITLRCDSSPSADVSCVEDEQIGDAYLVRDSGWGVRRMVEDGEEMRRVAYVQAEAFYVPVAMFDDFFFKFFQAEVLSALMHNIRNSPADRYACLVAEPVEGSNLTWSSGPVGVVDITVQRDMDILRYLDEEEFLYVSGIAVLKDFRRMKVGSSLLQACEALSKLWGFRHLVLRAYEDDLAARQLYEKQGFQIVSGDPKWLTTWIGRRRRVVMIKST